MHRRLFLTRSRFMVPSVIFALISPGISGLLIPISEVVAQGQTANSITVSTSTPVRTNHSSLRQGILQLVSLSDLLSSGNGSVMGASMVSAKHMPNNAASPVYTEAMASADRQLASIFGGPGAVAAANGFEPPALAPQYPLYRGDLIGDDGLILRGHLSHAMHLYGSPDGTATTDLYVPLGFTSHSNTPTPIDAAVTFFYPRLGKLTNVTLAVFHVSKFSLDYQAERVRIGEIGGPGGSISCYRHSHIEFYKGDTGLSAASLRAELRIDPIAVFESAEADKSLANAARTMVTR